MVIKWYKDTLYDIGIVYPSTLITDYNWNKINLKI